MGKKIAVVFPGIGYHSDKPLLYYSKKLVKEFGFEVIEVTYDFSFSAKEIKGNRDKMKDAFEVAIKQAEEQLSAMGFGNYDQVLFIGKSIGTTVAAYYDKTHNINAKHIVLTPVPQTFKYLKTGAGIVLHGDEDPWCETAIAREKCKELGLKLYVVEHANHSLETKSVAVDVQNMNAILDNINKYLIELSV